MIRGRRYVMVTLAALLCLVASLQAAANSEKKVQLTVASVIQHYEQRGRRIIWSTILVNPSRELPASALQSEKEFNAALKQYGLALKSTGNDGALVIVRATEKRTPKKSQSIVIEPTIIDEIIVSTGRYRLKQKQGKHAVSRMMAEQLTALPKLGDDVLRPVLRLPGMSSVGVSAQPHIRGGHRDEMLVLLSGIELVEPFHLKNYQNLFSGINPALVDGVDVYTGSFPVRYGNRMSGVMDISEVDPIDADRAVLGLSVLNAWASVSGSSAGGDAGWMVSVRRGNLDLFADEINPNVGVPRYSDYFAQGSYWLPSGGQLKAGALYYDGDIKLNDLSKGQFSESRYNNLYTWLKFDKNISQKAASHTSLSAVRISRSRISDTFDPSDLREDGIFEEDIDIDLIRLQQGFNFTANEVLSLEFGAGVQHNNAKYDFLAPFAERGLLENILGIELEDRAGDNTVDVLVDPDGISANAYLGSRWQWTPPLTLEMGVRWDYQNYGNLNGEQQLGPRFSAVYSPNSEHIFRGSVGRFVQPELSNELQVADGFKEFLPAQKADQWVVSYDFIPSAAWHLRLETYSRDIKNPKQRFENLFNPFVLVPELAADRVPIFAEKSKSSGIELSFDYRPSDGLWLWGNYTKARSKDYLFDMWEHRSWNQEHSINAGMVWKNEKWQLSATASWHSGWRTTSLPDNVSLAELPVDIVRNNAELPNYFSLDLKIARQWKNARREIEVFLEVTNATNRDNIGSVVHDLFENDDDSIDIVANQEKLLPLVPVLGVIWRLH